MASKSALSIDEILGIAPTPSASATPSGTGTPIGTLTPHDSEHSLEKLTTSTKSVADYFRERLLAKSSGKNTPVAVPTPVAATPREEASDDEDDSRVGMGMRGGLGSSRSFMATTTTTTVVSQEVETPRMGLGKFSSMLSSTFTAATSSRTEEPQPQTPSSEVQEDSEDDEDEEVEEKPKKKKRKEKESSKDSEISAKEAERKEKKKRRKEAKEAAAQAVS